jgi:large subunit ribosomal protein L5
MSYLEERYKKMSSELGKALNISNVMAIPKIDKVIISVGLGSYLRKGGELDEAIKLVTGVAGQKPCTTLAKVSVAAFKVREGMVSGLKVTLRKERMHAFLERLLFVGMPRERDFWGLSPSAHDGRGGFAFGMSGLNQFPEVNQIKDNLGMNITIQTTAKKPKHAKLLLEMMGFPFIGGVQS